MENDEVVGYPSAAPAKQKIHNITTNVHHIQTFAQICLVYIDNQTVFFYTSQH